MGVIENLLTGVRHWANQASGMVCVRWAGFLESFMCHVYLYMPVGPCWPFGLNVSDAILPCALLLGHRVSFTVLIMNGCALALVARAHGTTASAHAWYYG